MNTQDTIEADRIEKDLYKKYYEADPEGDARFDLWPDVIQAKKAKNPIEALKALYSEYGLEE